VRSEVLLIRSGLCVARGLTYSCDLSPARQEHLIAAGAAVALKICLW
jgi:hypothetical protein